MPQKKPRKDDLFAKEVEFGLATQSGPRATLKSSRNCQFILAAEEMISLPTEKRCLFDHVTKYLIQELSRTAPKQELYSSIELSLEYSYEQRIVYEINLFDENNLETLHHAEQLCETFEFSHSAALLLRVYYLKFKCEQVKEDIEEFLDRKIIRIKCPHALNFLGDLKMLRACSEPSFLGEAENLYFSDHLGRLHHAVSLILFESFQTSMKRQQLQLRIISKLQNIKFSKAKKFALTKEWWKNALFVCAEFLVFYYKRDFPENISWDPILKNEVYKLLDKYCPEEAKDEQEELSEEELKKLYGEFY